MALLGKLQKVGRANKATRGVELGTKPELGRQPLSVLTNWVEAGSPEVGVIETHGGAAECSAVRLLEAFLARREILPDADCERCRVPR